MNKMAFDGLVGDMGSAVENITIYELAYRGENIEGMKEHLKGEVLRRGVEICSPFSVDEQEDGKYRVGVRVRSLKGIV